MRSAVDRAAHSGSAAREDGQVALAAQEITWARAVPVQVVQQSVLIDQYGEFTASGAVGPGAGADTVSAAIALWGGVTGVQLNSYLRSFDRHEKRARELVFTTLAALAAWVQAAGFLERAWAGNECVQKEMSIRRLKSWQCNRTEEVWHLNFGMSSLLAAVMWPPACSQLACH